MINIILYIFFGIKCYRDLLRGLTLCRIYFNNIDLFDFKTYRLINSIRCAIGLTYMIVYYTCLLNLILQYQAPLALSMTYAGYRISFFISDLMLVSTLTLVNNLSDLFNFNIKNFFNKLLSIIIIKTALFLHIERKDFYKNNITLSSWVYDILRIMCLLCSAHFFAPTLIYPLFSAPLSGLLWLTPPFVFIDLPTTILKKFSEFFDEASPQVDKNKNISTASLIDRALRRDDTATQNHSNDRRADCQHDHHNHNKKKRIRIIPQNNDSSGVVSPLIGENSAATQNYGNGTLYCLPMGSLISDHKHSANCQHDHHNHNKKNRIRIISQNNDSNSVTSPLMGANRAATQNQANDTPYCLPMGSPMADHEHRTNCQHADDHHNHSNKTAVIFAQERNSSQIRPANTTPDIEIGLF